MHTVNPLGYIVEHGNIAVKIVIWVGAVWNAVTNLCNKMRIHYSCMTGRNFRATNRRKEMNHLVTKPTKWVSAQQRLRSAWASAQSDQSSLSKAWTLSYPLSAQRRLWSDWADAQADLSLRWAHTRFVGFVMSWLKCRLTRGASSKRCDITVLDRSRTEHLLMKNSFFGGVKLITHIQALMSKSKESMP